MTRNPRLTIPKVSRTLSPSPDAPHSLETSSSGWGLPFLRTGPPALWGLPLCRGSRFLGASDWVSLAVVLNHPTRPSPDREPGRNETQGDSSSVHSNRQAPPSTRLGSHHVWLIRNGGSPTRSPLHTAPCTQPPIHIEKHCGHNQSASASDRGFSGAIAART